MTIIDYSDNSSHRSSDIAVFYTALDLHGEHYPAASYCKYVAALIHTKTHSYHLFLQSRHSFSLFSHVRFFDMGCFWKKSFNYLMYVSFFQFKCRNIPNFFSLRVEFLLFLPYPREFAPASTQCYPKLYDQFSPIFTNSTGFSINTSKNSKKIPKVTFIFLRTAIISTNLQSSIQNR